MNGKILNPKQILISNDLITETAGTN